jgi:hypothetical protein
MGTFRALWEMNNRKDCPFRAAKVWKLIRLSDFFLCFLSVLTLYRHNHAVCATNQAIPFAKSDAYHYKSFRQRHPNA